jgi:antitoxin component of MazEF toxin-antitoxin module
MSTSTTRRILPAGGSKAVALPPEWLRASRLGCGDAVEVVHEGPLVIIRALKQKES